MAVRKLHGIPMSAPVARVLLTLYEKELDFELVPVDMKSGAHKDPSFLAMNPFGQVPVFEDCGLTLFESRAITKYLANTYKEQGTDLLCGCGKKGEVDLMIWSEVESQQFSPPATKLMLELLAKALFKTDAPEEKVVAENEAKLCKVLDVYEARLAQKRYLSGDCFGLADLHHVPTVNHLFYTPMKKAFQERPHVSKWVEDILGRPSWAKVLNLIHADADLKERLSRLNTE